MTCIIVRDGAYEAYDRLYAAFGHRMPVAWDRRSARTHASSETGFSASIPNRREKPPPSWTAFDFVVVDREPLKRPVPASLVLDLHAPVAV